MMPLSSDLHPVSVLMDGAEGQTDSYVELLSQERLGYRKQFVKRLAKTDLLSAGFLLSNIEEK